MNNLSYYLIKRAADAQPTPTINPERAVNAVIPAMNRLAETQPIQGVPFGDRLLYLLRGTNPHSQAQRQYTEKAQQFFDIQKRLFNLVGDQSIAPERRQHMVDTMQAPGKFREAHSKAVNRMQEDAIPGMVNPFIDHAGRHALRGGFGVLSDALFTDHDDDYGVMDNVTSGVGGILGGVAGTIIANKLTKGDPGASMAGNALGSAIGGWGLNKARRALFA